MIEKKRIDWEKVVNDVAEKNNKKHDFILTGQDITIDNVNGNLTKCHKFSNKEESFNFRVTDWALSQLFSKFNMPTSYFKNLYKKSQYDLIKEHLDYNINTQDKKDLFIRTVRPKDAERQVRAILTPTYTPFDDDKLIKIIRQAISDMNYNIELVDYKNDGLSSYFRLVFPDSMKDIKSDTVSPDDVVAVGTSIMNSPVGKSSVKIIPMMFRLVCKNGMLSWDTVGNKSDYYQRHSYIDQQEMYNFTLNTINKAVDIAYGVVNNFENLKKKEIQEPETDIPKLLTKADVPQRMHEPIMERFETYWQKSSNMFGLVNSMTRIARDLNQDDQQELESAAGRLTDTTFEELEDMEVA